MFGEVRRERRNDGAVVVRDTRAATPLLRWLARRMLGREARALAALHGLPGVPELMRVGRDTLERSWIEGQPLHRVATRDPAFFAEASALLRRIHAHNVAHNDLAKEPNVLVRTDGRPAFIDFQLAWHAPRRGRLFRMLAREDLRHLLKHKRSYCAEHLTVRERDILASPTGPARAWMGFGKPVYLFVTRRLLGWADREGAADRGARQP